MEWHHFVNLFIERPSYLQSSWYDQLNLFYVLHCRINILQYQINTGHCIFLEIYLRLDL